MANTTGIPDPSSGELEIQRVLGGRTVTDELGEVPANFTDGLDLGTSPTSGPASG